MRLKAIPLLVVLLGLSVLAPESRAQADGGAPDLFLNAYQTYQKGESTEGNKDYAGALRIYKQARGMLMDIKTKFPDWNISIVEYRLKRIDEAVTRLEAKVGAGSEPNVGGIPGVGTPDTKDLFPRTDVDPPILPPVEGEGTGRRSTPVKGKSPTRSGSGVEQIAQEIADLNARLKNADDDRRSALAKLAESQDKLNKETAERTKLEGQIKILRQRSETAEDKLLDANKSKTASAEQIQVLTAQMNKAKKDLRAALMDRDSAEEYIKQREGGRQAISDRTRNLEEQVKKANATSAELQKQLDEADKRTTAKVEVVQKKLDATEKELGVTQKELGATQKQLADVTTQRDQFKTEVEKMKEAQKDLSKLMDDNRKLMEKVSDAEKRITQMQADSTQKDAIIADLKKEVANVTKQLADVKKESASYQTKMSDLQAKLETTSEQLAMTKTSATAGAAETKRMTEENQLLLGIVRRQMTAQAGRDQMRKAILADMAKMEIKSESLLSRINQLGQPLVKLTPKEAALFKKPQVEVGDNEIAVAAAKQGPETATELPSQDPTAVPVPPIAPTPPAVSPSLALMTATPAPLTPPVVAATPSRAAVATPSIAKATPTTAKPVAVVATPIPKPVAAAITPAPKPVATPAPASKPEVPDLALLDTTRLSKPKTTETTHSTEPAPSGPTEPRTEPATSGNITESGAGASTVPTDLQPTAQAAKDQFDKGNYRDAEKLYETILAKAPTNLYALSNLGVVRFREGKLKLAEEAFRKAIAIAPEDAFSRCTLGIIYYSQSRFDEAVNELTKSLAINPKYAAAHNFLGITASQKGWQEAAQKELETATSLDPNYADAHFNLAVVYATQVPPNKENARVCYKRATDLGAEKDQSLEALLK